jgi:hypothetical protein
MEQHSLGEPARVTPEILVGFAHHDAVEAALSGICERVHQLCAQDIGTADDQWTRNRKPVFGWGYWEAWDRRKDERGNATVWFDWNALHDPTHQASDGQSLVFLSGLTAEDPAHLEHWFAANPGRRALLEQGTTIDGRPVRLARISDGYERFTRWVLPEQILIGATLDEQASGVAAWVVDTYRALTEPLERLESV